MRFSIAVAAALSVALADPGGAQTPAFHLQEATIASIHEAFARGELSCVQLTRAYLNRIEAYNLKGPALHAIITVNPRALDVAAEMDRQYRDNRAGAGPLHCIPMILKDNFDTADMPTSGGNISMKTSQPSKDAFTVAKMRKAGALILAKANMQEFARGGMSISSLGGQVLNPYDLTRTPGGSSGGTGASLAANLATIGTGSDTGQSIRSPSSANNLVGVRPTRGLVSRRGVIPASETQDEVGPIARTATDAALLLDVMAGYDPDDPVTAYGRGHIPQSYTHLLRPDALKGARIGVMSNLLGKEERHRDVNRVMEEAIAKIQSLHFTDVAKDVGRAFGRGLRFGRKRPHADGHRRAAIGGIAEKMQSPRACDQNREDAGIGEHHQTRNTPPRRRAHGNSVARHMRIREEGIVLRHGAYQA